MIHLFNAFLQGAANVLIVVGVLVYLVSARRNAQRRAAQERALMRNVAGQNGTHMRGPPAP